MSGFIQPIDELRAKLFNIRETRPDTHIYLLLDEACPVSVEHPLHTEQLAARAVQRERVRVVKAPGERCDDWQPTLLQLYRAGENGYADEALIELSLEAAMARCASINGSYVAAWIASELESDVLASRLANRCEVFDLLQARRRTIALYEPHRLALLQDDPEAQVFLREFMAQIHLWIFVDAAGSLRSVTSPDLVPQREQHSRQLSLAMCCAQARVPLAREVVLSITKAELTVPARAERRIDAQLIHADKLGLTHPADVIFFVLNCMTLSDQWHEHPQARRCIERSRDEGAPLAGLFGEMSDAELDAIGRHGTSR